MPRVTTATKSDRPTKRPYICTGCRQAIEPGQTYYTWKRRYQGSSYRHVACGRPMPSELSSRKTAQIEDEIINAEKALSAISVEVPAERPEDDSEDMGWVVEEARSILEQVASSARDVGAEYQESADNMPESLQYGYQAEAMREVAEELESWADDLESWDPSALTEVDLSTIEDWDTDAESAYSEVLEAILDEARSAMEDMPEYQG